MARNILIVHSSASMRKILKTRIQANLSDIVFFDVSSPREALKFLKKSSCHLVMFSWEALDEEWLDFFQAIKGVSGVSIDNFLLITQDDDRDHIGQARDLGVKEHLVIPCSDDLLLATINRICNPAFLRTSKRYSIPGAKALVEQGAEVFQANIINISQGGLLCEMDYSEGFLWHESVMLTASFDKFEEGIAVTGLASGIVRLTVLNPKAPIKQRRLRIAFIFMKIPPEVSAVLDRVFALADKLSLEVYDNVE